MKKYWQLFITFARIGLFTIGGGYAMLPMMQSELVERHGWATEQEMMDYYALAQCTPGAIAVNVSTFIGYKIAGVLGGVIATLGLVFPSLVIIIAIAAVLVGGGAELTPEGERLLEAYDDYCRQLRAFADGLFQEKFGYLQEE